MNRLALTILCCLWSTVPVFAAPPGAQGPAPKPDLVETRSTRPQSPAIVFKPHERVGLLRSSAGLSMFRLANGATMVDARGRYREFILASIDDRGVPHVGCFHDERAIRRVLEGRAQAAPVRFEEK